MYMEQIFRTLQELEELLKLIDKSSPEVPDILYKLAVEKAEAVTEKVKGLPSVNSGIPEDKMVSGNDSEDVIVDTCACGGEKLHGKQKNRKHRRLDLMRRVFKKRRLNLCKIL